MKYDGRLHRLWSPNLVFALPLLSASSSPLKMMNFFARTSSPPPVASSQPQTAPMPSQTQNMAEPPLHVIHSPLPSRPSPVQPASALDELLKGMHPSTPQPDGPGSSSAQHMAQPQNPPVAPPPQPLVQTQQPAQDRNQMDLLAFLSQPNVSSSPASVSSSQPVQDQSNPGRMLLDQLLK